MIPSEKVGCAAQKKPLRQCISIIDSRALERECFARAIEVVQPKLSVEAFATVAEWTSKADKSLCEAVLYNVEGRRLHDAKVKEELATLVKMSSPVPLMVLSPFEDLSEMISALDAGASGYIPASLGIEATLIAIRLAEAGAVFLPAKTIRSLCESENVAKPPRVREYFTPRQASVAEALRRGKSNKVIAYELNMCESTVKVHIRNIMKKLAVRNRTEAGFRLHSLMNDLGISELREGSAGFQATSTAGLMKT